MHGFPDTPTMLAALQPRDPVYCVHPEIYRESTRDFLDGFPGRVLYAIKANNEPAVISILHDAGVNHFDCASLPEIALAKRLCPEATCYFMSPVRIRGAAHDARQQFGVRHFMIDDSSGLPQLLEEIDIADAVIFVRMAVSHRSAAQDLSVKFGADPNVVPELLQAVADAGAEPALAFNVGTGVCSPDGYAHAIGIATEVLERSAVPVRLLDIGGGFPRRYPGYEVPPLDDFFDVIRRMRAQLPLAEGGELLAEPGRALSAPGLSAVTQVLLRKEDRLYINDGMYGALWELRFNGHKRYLTHCYRNARKFSGKERAFRVFGPTCDSSDCLPEPLNLPADINVGDYIEFLSVGAYSLSGRTDFNGFGSCALVTIGR
jgi:ornithine decarboxylase